MIDDRLREQFCPLCKSPAENYIKIDEQRFHNATCYVRWCDRCGRFTITEGALERLREQDAFHLISGTTREWSDRGDMEGIVSEENLATLINLAPKTLTAKRNRLLNRIASKAESFLSMVKIDPCKDVAFGYVKSKADFMFLLEVLHEKEMAVIDFSADPFDVTLTTRGWEHLETLEGPTLASEKAFVAMWFNEEVKSAYLDGIEPAIKVCGYKAVRIDFKEHSDSVIDQIVAEIKESRFVVADFTKHRNGVYYEAGFARGLGLDVIWCCREDHLADLHFDIKGFNVIVWKTTDELRRKLKARIRAVVGRGPLYNPANDREGL